MNNNDLKKIAERLIDTTNLAGTKSIELQKSGLRITIKSDKSPVSNGDLEVNKILTERIKKLTPNIPIVSEETVDLNKINNFINYWLIDPIDGTKEYIAGNDDYTLNAGLIINKKPVIGIIGVPKKNRLFYSYGKNNSFMIEKNITTRLDCKKKTPSKEVRALTNHTKPPQDIINKLYRPT